MTAKEVLQQVVNLLDEARTLIDQNEIVYDLETIDVEDLYYKLEEIATEIENLL
jgi:hypothetical protein